MKNPVYCVMSPIKNNVLLYNHFFQYFNFLNEELKNYGQDGSKSISISVFDMEAVVEDFEFNELKHCIIPVYEDSGWNVEFVGSNVVFQPKH